MGKYPRTEEQIIEKIKKKYAKKMKKRRNLLNKMADVSHSFDRGSYSIKRDPEEGYTPDSVKKGEKEKTEDKEYEDFKKEIEYSTRLNKIEDSTELEIKGNDDVKRKILDNKLEKTLLSNSDEISKIKSKGSLNGFYFANKNETYEKMWDESGREDIKKLGIFVQIEGKKKITTPTYDANTGMIAIPDKKDKHLHNKVGHELGHATIKSWGVPTEDDAPDERRGRIAEQYEEVSADILMKEKFGDEKAGEAVKNQLTKQLRGARNIVQNEVWDWNEEKNTYDFAYEKISAHRAKAEIFGLNDLKKEIDNQLFKQYKIDMNSKGDKRAETINSLTKTLTSSQGLNKKKYTQNLNEAMKIGMKAYGEGPG